MSEINDIDFEQDQQQVIEKTDIQTLASYCNVTKLQDIENMENRCLEKQKKKEKADKIGIRDNTQYASRAGFIISEIS